jgi:hypothetical protein
MIPWIGDIVRLNPESGHLMFHGRVGDQDIVNATRFHGDDMVLVSLNRGGDFDICLPDGRFFKDQPGAPSLFVLVIGGSKEPVTKGQHLPFPVPGSILETCKGSRFTIEACDCQNIIRNEAWPNGSRCGAHIRGGIGVCYTAQSGWLFDGLLFRNMATTAKVLDASELKAANTRPDAACCAACGGKLKDPGMGLLYRHCPKCEP